MEAKMEELDEETENQDLKNYLTEQVEGQITLLNQICKDEKRRNAQHSSVFATFMSVIQKGQQLDFMKAKDKVVQEVHSIQEDPSCDSIQYPPVQPDEANVKPLTGANDLSRVTEEHCSESSEVINSDDIAWPDEAFTQIEQNVETPYLPPATKPHTLVLDLDETLIHYNEAQ